MRQCRCSRVGCCDSFRPQTPLDCVDNWNRGRRIRVAWIDTPMTAPCRRWSFGLRTLFVASLSICLAVQSVASDEANEDALRVKAGERALEYVSKLTQGKIKLLRPPFCRRSDKPGTWNVVVEEDSLVIDAPHWLLEVTDAGTVADWWERNKPKAPAPTARPARTKPPVCRCRRIR
jgi:hypothetical protein